MISIIIPVFNGGNYIMDCLKSLKDQTIPGSAYEIIVVDDGSTDHTAEAVKGFDVKYFYQKNQGPAAARNLGVKMAKGDIVLFIDADCRATKNWIEEMVWPFKDPEIVGVKGVYKTGQRELVARFVQVEYENKYERMKKIKYIDFIDTYSAGFRKEIFLQYGGFDTSFPTASVEDQEFSFRLAKDGHKMVFQPDAVVYHLHPRNLKRYFRRKFYVAYWKVLVLKKHPQKLGTDSHTPQSLKSQILLTYGIGISLALTPFDPIFFLSALLSLMMFLLIALPLIIFALKRDKEVAVWAPAFLFLRSTAFCLGLMAGIFGIVRILMRKRRERVPAT